MATPFAPLKLLLAYLYTPISKNLLYMHCLHSLYRTKICAILVYSSLILVAMATPLAPSEIQIAYLNSTTPYTLLYVQKILRFLARNGNLCNFGLFLPIFGGNGNSLNSFNNSGRPSTFKFTKPLKPDYTWEKFLDVLRGMEYCAIGAFFV